MTKIEEYNSKIDFVSNSMLAWLNKSPAYFQHKLKYNNDELKEYKSLENGKLLHSYIESPKDFVISEVVKPSDMMCKWVEEAVKYDELSDSVILKSKEITGSYKSTKDETKTLNLFKTEGSAYYSFLKDTSGKQCITKEQKNTISKCITSLENNSIINNLLFNYQSNNYEVFVEECIYWDFPIKKDWLGIPEYLGKKVNCKSRLDRRIIDHEKKLIIINDLKTTSENPYGNLEKVHNTKVFNIDYKATGWFMSYVKYRYDKQAYFYISAVIASLIKEYPDYEVVFNFIVVETKNTYDTAIYQFNKSNMENLDYAKMDIEKGLQSYLYHMETGNWNYPLDYSEIIEI